MIHAIKLAFKKNAQWQVRLMLKSYYKATPELLAKDFVILNHGQITTTFELEMHSPNYLTTPTGRLSSSTDLKCIAPLHGGSSMLQFMTCRRRARYFDHGYRSHIQKVKSPLFFK
ncbi:hypothetical protein TNCV_2485781 [Trichonephila clavipes]|uniref:Uncharacterized protein n=1 Tax=Trichonephila clavipes TaxID=2585209 RepID=A0A8X7BB81_TRICX|nr:hypothetical protein TNCV_2485781 [Trichonephila clavipes]